MKKLDQKEIAMYVLGALIITGFFSLLIILVFKDIPAKNENMLNIVIGALIAAFTSVVAFFYGSSAGSKEKTALMAKNSENEQNQNK